ncbi:MAG: hypothetical protein ACHQ53_17820, partial [Polyangiales bacterium]
LALTLWFVASVLPLVLADRHARFFAFGALSALVPACTTHPNNRLLFFIGLGVMGLLSQLWHGLVEGAAWLGQSRAWRASARVFTAGIVGFHLLLSPLLLPLSACEIALTSGTEDAVRSALELGKGKDLVIVDAPDYFYVKLLPVLAALEQRPPPRRLRALSFGAVPLVVERRDASTLEVQFVGGLLREPLMQLYRASQLKMQVGEKVVLEGLVVEVLGHTANGLVNRARFSFDAPLDAPRFSFVYWDGSRYAPLELPAIGRSVRLPPARLRFGL